MTGETDNTSRLMQVVALATKFCSTVENAAQFEKEEFVRDMTEILPELYLDFATLEVPQLEEGFYTSDYVDEDYYESMRRGMEGVLGPDDMYLDASADDMKYSDTPIAVSISESLADIFQDLYNFVWAVRETDGALLNEAYTNCAENFRGVWAEKLVSVMCPLTRLRFHGFQDNY